MRHRAHNAFICDQVRFEQNGKLFVIGMYSGSVIFPGFPALAQFTLVCLLPSPEGRRQPVVVRGFAEDTQIVEVKGELSGPVNAPVWVPVQLPPLNFEAPVLLSFRVKVGDGEWAEVLAVEILLADQPQPA